MNCQREDSESGNFGGSRWGTTVTLLLVRAPGCYGLQLDSERGTGTIILRVTRAA